MWPAQQAAALRDNEPTTTDDERGRRRRSCGWRAAARAALSRFPYPGRWPRRPRRWPAGRAGERTRAHATAAVGVTPRSRRVKFKISADGARAEPLVSRRDFQKENETEIVGCGDVRSAIERKRDRKRERNTTGLPGEISGEPSERERESRRGAVFRPVYGRRRRRRARRYAFPRNAPARCIVSISGRRPCGVHFRNACRFGVVIIDGSAPGRRVPPTPPPT